MEGSYLMLVYFKNKKKVLINKVIQKKVRNQLCKKNEIEDLFINMSFSSEIDLSKSIRSSQASTIVM
jgi:hypothetical protein